MDNKTLEKETNSFILTSKVQFSHISSPFAWRTAWNEAIGRTTQTTKLKGNKMLSICLTLKHIHTYEYNINRLKSK